VRARLPGLWGRAVRVILRQQFRNVGSWAWITLVGGILMGTTHLLYSWCILTQQAMEAFLAIGTANLFAMILLYVVALRKRKFADGDRQTLTVAVGMFLATCLLPVLHRPKVIADLTTYRLSVFPLNALVLGLGYFIMGSLFWGGFYLYGLSFFVLSLIMKFGPAWTSLLLGAYYGVTQVLLGLYLLRLNATPE
jgi:hypothetical protein